MQFLCDLVAVNMESSFQRETVRIEVNMSLQEAGRRLMMLTIEPEDLPIFTYTKNHEALVEYMTETIETW